MAWGEETNLIFNPEKTICMLRKPKKIKFLLPNIKMNGITLERSDRMTYLGVILHNSGSWETHRKCALIKATKRFSACLQIAGRTWGLSKDLRLHLYKTIFVSTFLYGAAVWANELLNSKSGRKKLVSAQRSPLVWCSASYSKVSSNALQLLTRQLPLDLEAELIVNRYKLKQFRKCPWLPTPSESAAKNKKMLLAKAHRLWAERANDYGLRLHDGLLVKGIISEQNRREIDYFSMQFLTGQGGFGSYLHNIHKIDTPDCIGCGVREDSAHIVFDCPLHNDARIGSGLNDHILADRKIDWSEDGTVMKKFSIFCKSALKKIASFHALLCNTESVCL